MQVFGSLPKKSQEKIVLFLKISSFGKAAYYKALRTTIRKKLESEKTMQSLCSLFRNSILSLILLTPFLLSACSGGSSEGSANTSASASAGKYASVKRAKVDYEHRGVLYAFLNSARTREIVLIMPFYKSYPGEQFELGTNDVDDESNYGKGILFMHEFEPNKNGNITFNDIPSEKFSLTGSWISTSGMVDVEEAGIKNGDKLKGLIHEVDFVQFDLKTNKPLLDGKVNSLSEEEFSAEISEGGIDDIVITNLDKLSGTLGTQVRMRAHNLPSEVKVRFEACADEMPTEIMDEYNFTVNVTSYCSDARFHVEDKSDQTNFYTLGLAFKFDKLPQHTTTEISSVAENAVFDKAVYDAASGNLYIHYQDSEKILVYSSLQSGFLQSISLPHAARTFDLAFDKPYILISKENQLFLLDSNFEVFKTWTVEGDNILDIAITANKEALILSGESQDSKNLHLVSLSFDDQELKNVEELSSFSLAKDPRGEVKFQVRKDRKAVLISDAEKSFSKVVSLNEDGNWKNYNSDLLPLNTVLLMHPNKDELFTDEAVVDYEHKVISDLAIKKLLPALGADAQVVGNIDADGNVVLAANKYFEVYSSDSERLFTSMLGDYESDAAAFGPVRFVGFAQDETQLLVLTQHRVFEYYYPEIQAELSE